MQAALGRVTGESPLPQGSGRTDAGVHALGQVASFPLRAPIPDGQPAPRPEPDASAAIRVLEAQIVSDAFHARHSTVAKTYEYRVFLERPLGRSNRVVECPPFLARYVYAYPWPLDFEALQDGSRAVSGTHDFLSFAATDPDAAPLGGELRRTLEDEDRKRERAIRTIFGSSGKTEPIGEAILFIYRVRGNGFLHHMVRNLVGTMLDVGRGYRPRRGDSRHACRTIACRRRAHRTGARLFLHSVEYPPTSRTSSEQ